MGEWCFFSLELHLRQALHLTTQKGRTTMENTKLEKARELVAQMTLEEKVSLCSGMNFWQTKAVQRLGVASFMVTDGPHGLRKQDGDPDHLGVNGAVAATCFPTAAATACSFDPELMERMGTAMGEECRAEKVDVILGPAANIKRSPLCGRNFEYFSEDPLLTGQIAAGLVNGIQSQNVGTSVKHYLANNQETARLTTDSIIDERALREIYLTGYEIAIQKAHPWTLMCSYNKINGTYASDNKRLMTDIPRGEWGYTGAIMTDWGAMNDRVAGIHAGLDLEMPGPCPSNDAKILQAVRDGSLTEAEVDQCAVRITELALRAAENQPIPCDKQAHHELARQVARESAVLLRKGACLPLQEGKKLAVIGAFAAHPRYQGAGSSKIVPTQIVSLCDALKERSIAYTYAQGFEPEGQADAALVEKAVETAKAADVAVVMLGLPDSYESEGFDREHMHLPENQNQLMQALAETGTPLVVVLSTGSVVQLPWREQADSILLMYLAGQNSGNALLDLLLGQSNPCGKLAESWPVQLQDNPSHGFFGGRDNIEYRESIYVGYRYYDKARKEVAYPFGHGLSYTEFAYSDLKLSTAHLEQTEELGLTVTVTNSGDRAGKEVVQVYVAPPTDGIFRPVRELRAFQKVALEPGQSKTITLSLNRRAFSYYNVQAKDWQVDGGEHTIEVGSSSRDIRLSQKLTVAGPKSKADEALSAYRDPASQWPVPQEQFEAVLGRPVPEPKGLRPFTMNSTMSDVQVSAIGRQLKAQIVNGMAQQFDGNTSEGASEFTKIINSMMADMPLRQLPMISGGAFTHEIIAALVEQMNREEIEEEA